MVKVLYISNIEVPYRSEYFNQLSEKTDLTVLYERKKSSNRDTKWTKSNKSKYNIKYLRGINYKREYKISFSILKYVFSKKYDVRIIGCYNSPSEIIAILFMRLFRKKYILNIDGEYFLEGKSLKKKIKRFVIKGATKYFVAGEITAKRLEKFVNKNKIHIYHFSSLTSEETRENNNHMNINKNNKIILVGQFYDYKGLDIALKCAQINETIQYVFIGSGKNSDLLKEQIKEMKLSNVEVIPFLLKKELFKEYQNCSCFILPSRQECWGLVINEAASFGCPIVSTNTSGAGVEFLSGVYDKFLVEPNNEIDLYNKIMLLINYKEIESYKKYLIEKSKLYSIEENVSKTLEVINTNK